MNKKSIVVIVIIIAVLLIVVYGKSFMENNADVNNDVAEVADTSYAVQNNMGHGHMTENQKPFYQGEIVNFEHGGGYTYIEVKEATDMTFWIAVEKADVKKGDFIKFQEELVMHDFKSKALNKTYKEIMFASNLQYKVKD